MCGIIRCVWFGAYVWIINFMNRRGLFERQGKVLIRDSRCAISYVYGWFNET